MDFTTLQRVQIGMLENPDRRTGPYNGLRFTSLCGRHDYIMILFCIKYLVLKYLVLASKHKHLFIMKDAM